MPETVNSSEVLNAPVLRYAIYIKGQYSTLAELQAAHPTGSEEDAYGVGDKLYIWSDGGWLNTGEAFITMDGVRVYVADTCFRASQAINALLSEAQNGQVIVATENGYTWRDASAVFKE